VKRSTVDDRVEAETDFVWETIEGASLARRAGSDTREGSREETKAARFASPGSDTRLTAFSRAGMMVEVTSSLVRLDRKNGEKAF
jgi:hypothetical protein